MVGVAGATFAVTLIIMQLGFRETMFAAGVQFHQHLVGDLFMISPNSKVLSRMSTFPRRRLVQARAIAGVRSVSPIYTAPGLLKNPEAAGVRQILVVGFDPKDRVFDLPEIVRNTNLIRMPDTGLYDAQSRPEFGPIADTFSRAGVAQVAIEDRWFTIVGLFRLGTTFAVDGTVVTSELNFSRIFSSRSLDEIDIGSIALEPGADPTRVQRMIEAAIPQDVLVLTRSQLIQRETEYWDRTTPIGYVFAFGTIIGFVVGAIILYQILFSDITDHLKEYATLKALGFSNQYLFGVVFQESLILAVLGYIFGIAIASQLYNLTEIVTRLPMHLQPKTCAFVFVITIVMSSTSAALSLRRVVAADPAEVF
jgi:putative ABC transport system permease protein